MFKRIAIGVYLTGLILIILAAIENNPDPGNKSETIIGLLIITLLAGSILSALDIIFSDHMKGGACLRQPVPVIPESYDRSIVEEPRDNKNVSFKKVVDADHWLSENLNVEVTGINIPTRYSVDISGGHNVAKSVEIKYLEHPMPTGYQYGLVEVEIGRYFLPINEDNYLEKWARKYPDAQILWTQNSAVVRRQEGIHFFNMGLDRRERMKIFILFRRKVMRGASA